ncbi:MAG: type II toxin-antitoxin system death-on-curing family toxin [Christensenellaceae bacterium]|nr:type II toxin-antitoxin system death-on-curing family toxin [Christensenellaceae bacterium]
MIRFSRDKVKLIHQLLAEETGGSIGVRDEGLLDSALESAFATFDGVELYPSKEEKAAKIAYSLVSNHAFVDGNKRIGVFVMLSFLSLNGIRIDATDEDIVQLGLGIADGSVEYEWIVSWIKAHRTEN